MNNIVIAGLIYDPNLGDQVIYECSRDIINEFIEKHGIKNIELRGMDITGRNKPGRSVNRAGNDRSTSKARIKGIAKYLLEKSHIKSYVSCRRIRKKCFQQCRRFIDKDTKAVIFAGGGLIKYKYQNIQHYIDIITRYANKFRIPVMISAVGVEDYDENHKECQRLKNALNRKCVKVITTRDDIELLNNSYITDKSIITARVADPACSFSRYYKPENTMRKYIGLGVVREGLFIENGIDFNKEQMMHLWRDICNELNARGYDFKFFTNGLGADFEFAEELVEKLMLGSEKLVKKPGTVHELAEIISGFNAIIVCRLHASIVAYSYGISSVGLVWNNKQTMFGECIGYPERFVTVDKFDANYIVDIMEKAMTEGYNENIRAQYCASTKDYLETFADEYILNS